MKIGIITQPLYANYGGILQNFALQEVLRKMGHTPVTLGVKAAREPSAESLWFYVRVFISHCIGRCKYWPHVAKHKQWATYCKTVGNAAVLRLFVNKYINIPTERFSYKEDDLDELGIDLLITGSDQVWRPKYVFSIEAMFFNWVKRHSQIPRLAYAASFGIEKWDYTKEQEKACRELVKSFRAVSVREDSGVELCKDHLGVEATWVLDPTLLLSADEYGYVCRHVESPHPYLFVYMLDEDSELIRLAREYAVSHHLEMVVAGAESRMDARITVEQWLAYFRDAQYVITNSFRGTVFSTIFHKPFAVFLHKSRGNARIDSLMNMLQLHSRVVSDKLPLEEVDWEKVDERINRMKDISMKFLKDNCKL